jgi:curved DNA-binding protein CbpA
MTIREAKRILKEHGYKVKMTVAEALKTFELSDIPEKSELKIQYRNLSKKYHPDVGGSVEKMALVNEAYEVLSNTSTEGTTENFNARRKEREEKSKQEYQMMQEYFDRTFNFENLQTLLEGIIGEKLSGEVEHQQSSYYTSFGFNAEIKLFTEDKTKYFVLTYNIRTIYQEATGLGNDSLNTDDLMFNININTSILYNNKSVKLASRTYKTNVGSKTLEDFSSLFPAEKIQKALMRSKKKLFRKADMLLGLKRLLNATVKDEYIYLFCFNNEVENQFGKPYIYIFRSVFMKMPYYNIVSIYGTVKDKQRQIHKMAKSIHFYETENCLELLTETLNGCKLDFNNFEKSSQVIEGKLAEAFNEKFLEVEADIIDGKK